MGEFFHQLKIILWKNYLLRKRHKIRMFIEFFWPLVLFLILVWVRTRGLKENRGNCHLTEKTLPSVGGFEFFQNFLCSLNNTCHHDYVEDRGEQTWSNAGINKLITNATPILERLMNNNQTLPTMQQLWNSLSTVSTLASGLRSKSEVHTMGHIKAEALMTPESKTKFLDAAPLYTGLTSEELNEALNTEINLDALDSDTLNEIMEEFRTGGCASAGKTTEVLKPPSLEILQKLCSLGPQKGFLLLYVFTSYIDRDGLAAKIQLGLKADELLKQELSHNTLLLGPYDQDVLESIYQLGRLVSSDTPNVTSFLNTTGPIMPEDTVRFYEFMCGTKAGKGNNTIFGMEVDSANRYDTLRDRLKDWKKDSRFEPDPELSAVCNTIFLRFEMNHLTSFVWKQLKPYLRGFIFYAPENEFTRDIMQRVDDKFGKIHGAEEILNSLINVIHRIRYWIRNHADQVKLMKDVISDTKTIDTVLNMLGVKLNTEERDMLESTTQFVADNDIESMFEKMDLVAEVLSELVHCIRFNKSKGFETEEAAVAAALQLLNQNTLWGVVIFENSTNDTMDEPKHVKYKIRMDSDKVDSTRSAHDRLTTKHPRRRPVFDLKYITHGFVFIQEFVEQSIIERQTGRSLDNFMVYLQQFPYPCYIYDQFVRAISRTFPLFMMLSWVYAASMIIKSIVLEREKHLREIMKIMGLGNAVIWIGWFVDSFAVMSISATVLSAILKWGKVIELADFTLIWVFMLSYTVSVICFSFFISTFFSRANSAAAAGGIIFFVMYLPYNFILIWEERLTWYHMLSGCLISNIAFGFGCNYFARLEEDGVGAQWSRISLQTLPDDDFNLSYCILMLWFDSFLYILLTLYMEAIVPSASGIPKPWYFPFQLSTYVKKKGEPKMIEKGSDASPLTEEEVLVEPEPEGYTCGVQVVGLCKTYSNGKVAVRNLNLNFYENQITSFLGHNGAGKTTTISILTGLFPPTEGTAYIYGHNIRTHMSSIRHDLGICPQFNVLFDRLTVSDHIIFFSGLKGKQKQATKDDIEEILMDLGIPQKRNEFPQNLSGGMKRKLCVAIAFVGGSKTVFLDEPTSGVDPFSRRSIWELLLKYKQNRTIILTTHFMDEADLLGDRIAIISQGKLKTCGSSLYLKNNFGQGYSLHLVKKEQGSAGCVNEQGVLEEDSEMSATNKPVSIITSFIRYRIPDALLVDNVGTELAYLLPYESSPSFSTLFDDLDANLNILGVSSYGISDTTLEDIFLKITIEDLEIADKDIGRRRKLKALFGCCYCCVAKQDTNKIGVPKDGMNGMPNGLAAQHTTPDSANGNAGEAVVDLTPSTSPESLANSTPETNTLLSNAEKVEILPRKRNKKCCWSSCYTQIWVIFMKRARNSKRNLKAMFFEIILPAVFIAMTLAFTLILPKPTNEPPLEISPFIYSTPSNIFFSDKSGTTISEQFRTSNESNGTFLEIPSGRGYFPYLVDEIVGPVGVGTACLKPKLKDGICHPKEWSNASVAKFHIERAKFTKADATMLPCSCATGSEQCPRNVEPKRPPRFKTPTRDLIVDTTHFRIPEWLEKTYMKYYGHRYGGYEFQLKKPYPVNLTYFVELLDGLTSLSHDPTKVVRSSEKRNSIKIWFDNKGWVSSIAYLNSLHNVMLRSFLPVNVSKDEYGITLIQHPLNLTESQNSKESLKVSALGVIHAICIIFALSFIPASFTVYLIEERASGGKHLHLVSGVKPITYWIANFLYDMVKYTIPAVLCLLLFIAFDAKAYISEVSIGAFCLLLFLYGWASIPLMYPASYMFSIPSTAFVALACGNLFVGVITTVSTFVLEQFGESDEELQKIGEMLKKLFLVFPQYCLGRGLIELVRLDIIATAEDSFLSMHYEPSRFEWKYLGKMHFCLLVQGIGFFLFNIIIDYKQVIVWICKRKVKHSKDDFPDEDEDVHAERDRVCNQVDTSDPNIVLAAKDLTKFYSRKPFPSVNRICFAMGKGECFGLLGVNGAGKTSTFKMLTGDVRISGGKACICNNDVEINRDTARKHFGYCPQEDAFDPLLNSYEILELYGRLRGMTYKETIKGSKELIDMLGLTRYARRCCGTYSGGNKRKLSTAIALIGDPDVVFLDEPTSGMDPGARRQLWKVILRLIHTGKSVVLTSHSMEECEALCTRLGIMVNGRFVCLGSSQRLKNRFGTGYMLTVRSEEPEEEQRFIELMKSCMPYAKLEFQHCSQLKYSIPQHEAKLKEIFHAMFSAKGTGMIEDYSLSQTTLDDIFVRFASQQKDILDR
ncbi:unnamed protein product [Allacma fusca]|uniref:ABC transporter domain-containing protein n=1 Tax=Allacma fusca TaxID=39272 RepID=A0A8J2KWZ6_9HEXA|nr:unnamed protein product [Allacma fusca]